MNTIASPICILLIAAGSVFAESLEDSISFMHRKGGSNAAVVSNLNAHFEGFVDAISIGRYDGDGTTTYPQMDSPRRIGNVANGIITVDGIEFGLDGFVTDTIYPPNGPAMSRYVGASENLLICIFYSETFNEGYSIDFYSGDDLQPDRYNVAFQTQIQSNKALQPTPSRFAAGVEERADGSSHQRDSVARSGWLSLTFGPIPFDYDIPT